MVGNQFDTICFLPNTSSWLGRKHNLIRTSKTTWLLNSLTEYPLSTKVGKPLTIRCSRFSRDFKCYKIHNFSVKYKRRSRLSVSNWQVFGLIVTSCSRKSLRKFFQVFHTWLTLIYFYISDLSNCAESFWNYHIKEIQGLTMDGVA